MNMFTNLGQILQPSLPRTAESTDTHLYLRQQERDHGRGKKDRKKEDADSFSTDDFTSISIDALYAFLCNLLEREGIPPPSTNAAGQSFAPLQGISAAETAPDNMSARAAGAYAHAAQTAPQEIQDVPQTIAGTQTAAAETSTAQRLLKDVEILKNRGIRELQIERADTFLDSLFLSIEKAKTL